MPNPDLDPIDCRIVAALQADGRLTNLELAEQVGLSPSPCLRRVKRLERDGYIRRFGRQIVVPDMNRLADDFDLRV